MLKICRTTKQEAKATTKVTNQPSEIAYYTWTEATHRQNNDQISNRANDDFVIGTCEDMKGQTIP